LVCEGREVERRFGVTKAARYWRFDSDGGNGVTKRRLVAAVAASMLFASCGAIAPPSQDAAVVGPDAGACAATVADGLASLQRISVDQHFHPNGCGAGGDTPDGEIVRLMGQQDLQVADSLIWGGSLGNNLANFQAAVAAFTGMDDVASLPDRILHADLEVSFFAADRTGHLVLLGLGSLDFAPDPFSAPTYGGDVLDWAMSGSPRLVAGLAHLGVWPDYDSNQPPPTPLASGFPAGLPVYVALGALSFVQIDIQPNVDLQLKDPSSTWRALENSGFRLALTGGSDNSCAGVPGATRTHVWIEPPLTFDAYLDAIHKRRTVFATDDVGWVGFSINGVPLGGDVAAHAGQTLAMVIDADVPAATMLDVLANGQVIGTVALQTGPQQLERCLSLPESAWVSLRGHHIATSAIYVTLDGKPILPVTADACYFVRYLDAFTAAAPTATFDFAPSELPRVLSDIATARQAFFARAQMRGPTDCKLGL
jgi:hypothetical protein